MEALTTKIKELVSYLQGRIGAVDAAIGKNKTVAALLAKKADDLAELETKLGSIATSQSLIRQAKDDKEEAEELSKITRRERDELNKDVSAHKENKTSDLGRISVDRANAHNEIEKARKEWVNLKKEQESWKVNFYTELKNKAK